MGCYGMPFFYLCAVIEIGQPEDISGKNNHYIKEMMKEQQNVIFASNCDIKLKKGNFFTPMAFQYSVEDFL